MIVKDQEEIEILKEGGKRLAGILSELAKEAKPGVSLEDLDLKARKLAEEAGGLPSFLGYKPAGAGRPFPAAICVSINDEAVHGIPNKEPGRRLEEGDVVGIDMGLTYKGLVTDSTVTVGVGKIGKTAEHLIETTRKCLEAGVGAARVGANIGAIGYAMWQVTNKTSFTIIEELGGHGVGKSVHEKPFVPSMAEKSYGPKLKEGQVIAIEPILAEKSPDIKLLPDGYTYVTVDGGLSAEFEHTVIVTKEGPLVVTSI